METGHVLLRGRLERSHVLLHRRLKRGHILPVWNVATWNRGQIGFRGQVGQDRLDLAKLGLGGVVLADVNRCRCYHDLHLVGRLLTLARAADSRYLLDTI